MSVEARREHGNRPGAHKAKMEKYDEEPLDCDDKYSSMYDYPVKLWGRSLRSH